MKNLTILLASVILVLSLMVTITLTLSETVKAKDHELQELPGVTDVEMVE